MVADGDRFHLSWWQRVNDGPLEACEVRLSREVGLRLIGDEGAVIQVIADRWAVQTQTGRVLVEMNEDGAVLAPKADITQG